MQIPEMQIPALQSPEEESAWQALNASFHQSLGPSSPLEAFLVIEITRAAWRIRRCNNIEASLINRLSDPSLDPMEDPATRDSQNAVDRARGQAERSMARSLAELRRIRNARPCREESLPEASVKTAGPELPKPAANPEDEAGTPRNAPCPCGSGQKHKRCCGRNAPAVLGIPCLEPLRPPKRTLVS